MRFYVHVVFCILVLRGEAGECGEREGEDCEVCDGCGC